MDFTLDEDLQSLSDLAGTIFGDLAGTDRVREIESSETRIDAKLWDELGKAGLLGLVLPEEHGGAGLGLDALCVVLEAQGRHVAPVPLWSSGVAALAVARFGSTDQQSALLPAAASGEARIALALEEYDGAEPTAPLTRAVAEGETGASTWRLTGTKAVVPSLAGARWALVSATADDDAGLFLIDLGADGITTTSSATTSHDLAGELVLDAVAATAVGTPGDRALAVTLRTAAIALAAVQVGVTDGSMRLAATYLSGREQFGRPLGSFQAVHHQLADCWIDVDAMRVTLWQALASDADDPLGADTSGAAERAGLVAKWWCDKAGLDVVHRSQHVHGGIGIDVDYPVHRHFLWGKQISSTLGGEYAALAALGDLIATTEVAS